MGAIHEQVMLYLLLSQKRWIIQTVTEKFDALIETSGDNIKNPAEATIYLIYHFTWAYLSESYKVLST